jgi:hypothetical protein
LQLASFVATTNQRKAVHALLIAVLLSAPACESQSSTAIEPVYDSLTGKLQLMKSDTNGNGKVDTVSHMDGTRVLRIDIDNDEDGKVDRWEYYDADQRLEKIGTSRANDGKEDAWLYPAAAGAIQRVAVSTRRDGKIDRTEFYEHDALVRAEEDGDGDGKTDKWETYESGRLASVAFDTVHRGTPDRRFVYGVDGTTRLETDVDGSGHFVAADTPPPPTPSTGTR